MSETIKERVIGAVVLLCLGVIFIPPFYDGRSPFDKDFSSISNAIPRKPSFPNAEKMANELAPIGSGHLQKIEKKVKQTIPKEERGDSLLPKKEERFYSQTLKDFDASEMTTKLLSDIASSTRLTKGLRAKSDMRQVWAVQVASFKNVDNAQELRSKLLSRGFQAYIKTVVKNGGTISRVYAGSSFDREVLEKIKSKSDQEFPKQKAVIVPYLR